METLSERIKYLRKDMLHLTQVEFGKKIGIAGTTVTGWEKRNVNPSKTALKTICNEFNINYSWLTEGQGDIEIKSDDQLLQSLSKAYNLRDCEIELVKNFLKLDSQERDTLLKVAQNMLVEK